MLDLINVILDILMAAIGLVAIINARVPISPHRAIVGQKARILGALLLVAVGMSLFEQLYIFSAVLFILILIAGFALSQKEK